MEDVLLIVSILIALVIGLVIAGSFFIYFLRKSTKKNTSFVLLSVQVSKENELGPIVAEQIFATVHSLGDKIGFWERLKGNLLENLSFEIAHLDKQIKFYFRVPVHLRQLVEGQIYAQYPDVEIVEVADFSQKPPIELAEPPRTNPAHSSTSDSMPEVQAIILKEAVIQPPQHFKPYNPFHYAYGAELTFLSPDIYPIKRYPQFEDKLTRVAVDPIAGITASISKLGTSRDQAWIQLVIRPLPDKWRKVYVNCVRILNKGIFSNIEFFKKVYAQLFIKRSRWFRLVFFPLYVSFFFQGLRSGAKKRKTTDLLSGRQTSDDDDELIEEMSRSHERETDITAALDKVVKLLFECTIRIVYIPHNRDQQFAKNKVREIAGSFRQFNIPHLNGFGVREYISGRDIVHRYVARQLNNTVVMNTEELATIFHLPNKVVMTPNIYWIRSKKLEPPSNLPSSDSLKDEDFTLLGRTNFRGHHEEFGIKSNDRRRHIYIIGKTGMGKSTLLENMIFSDIARGKGIAVVDPHGDLADNVMNFVPSWRTNHIIVIDPADRDFPISFNMLENINPAHNSMICSGLIGIFKKLYADSWGPRLEHILRNTVLSLLEYPNATMLGITRILQDASFRKKVVAKVTDPIVKSFWLNEFEKMQDRNRIEAISPILNKVGQFLSSPIVRNIVGQPKSAIDFRFAMDKGKVVIINLSKGKLGEDMSSLLGSMIITKFQLDAMSRADIAEKDRKDFYLYVDEFQNFATDSFATILSEARKYRLNLTMANQYIAQMPEEVRDAVFGNVGTIISFQVGFTDAEFLALQFTEEVTENDLVSLSKYTAYSRLLVDGMPTKTFSFDTLPPPVLEEATELDLRREKIMRVSRQKYAKERALVEDKINRWHEIVPKELEKTIVSASSHAEKITAPKQHTGQNLKPEPIKKPGKSKNPLPKKDQNKTPHGQKNA